MIEWCVTVLVAFVTVTVPLQVETSIVVTGNSKPADAIVYNNSQIFSRRGPLVEHKYVIFVYLIANEVLE